MDNNVAQRELIGRLETALATQTSLLVPNAIALLRQLIRTPSVTGDEGDHRNEHSVAGQLWRSLAGMPDVARFADSVFPGRDNVIAVLGNDRRRIMVLDAHTDTVPAGEPDRWFDQDPYSAVDGEVVWLGDDRVRLVVDGREVVRPIRRRMGRLWEARSFSSAPVIYGRGSFDNKGPVLVAWLATAILAAALERENAKLAGTLVTAFVVDEEAGMAGTRALVTGDDSWLARQGLAPEELGLDGMRVGITGIALDGSYGCLTFARSGECSTKCTNTESS